MEFHSLHIVKYRKGSYPDKCCVEQLHCQKQISFSFYHYCLGKNLEGLFSRIRVVVNQLLFHIEMILPQVWSKRYSIRAQI